MKEVHSGGFSAVLGAALLVAAPVSAAAYVQTESGVEQTQIAEQALGLAERISQAIAALGENPTLDQIKEVIEAVVRDFLDTNPDASDVVREALKILLNGYADVQASDVQALRALDPDASGVFRRRVREVLKSFLNPGGERPPSGDSRSRSDYPG